MAQPRSGSKQYVDEKLAFTGNAYAQAEFLLTLKQRVEQLYTLNRTLNKTYGVHVPLNGEDLIACDRMITASIQYLDIGFRTTPIKTEGRVQFYEEMDKARRAFPHDIDEAAKLEEVVERKEAEVDEQGKVRFVDDQDDTGPNSTFGCIPNSCGPYHTPSDAPTFAEFQKMSTPT